jgi:hypothetical protein
MDDGREEAVESFLEARIPDELREKNLTQSGIDFRDDTEDLVDLRGENASQGGIGLRRNEEGRREGGIEKREESRN